MDLIQVGVSVASSWKKNPLRQSQGEASPASRAKWSLHFVHNLCLVWPLFWDLLRKELESPVPRDRLFCHAGMVVARDSLRFRPFIRKFSLARKRGAGSAGSGTRGEDMMEWINAIYWSNITGLAYGSQPFWCSSAPCVRGFSSCCLSGHISGAQ